MEFEELLEADILSNKLATKKIINNRHLYFQPDLEKSDYEAKKPEGKFVDDYDEANLITSKVIIANKEFHKPILDLDFECYLIPSSPGRNHLYINKAFSPENYLKLLEIMTSMGLIGYGNLKQHKKLGMSCARLPTNVKENLQNYQIDFKEKTNQKYQTLFKKYKKTYVENIALQSSLEINKQIIARKDQEIATLRAQLKKASKPILLANL